MKKLSFFISIVFASSLFFVGCGGGSSSGVTNGVTDGVTDGDGEVVDKDAPIIMLLLGDIQQDVVINTDYVEWGALAYDAVDGDISANIVIDASDINTSAVGSYNVTYNVSDAAGNAAVEQIRVVNVIDEDVTAPVITLLGDNPQFVKIDTDYVELNATAVDNVDGNITDRIVIDASDVNTSAEGNYTVIYTVTDDANNTAEANRTVSVVLFLSDCTDLSTDAADYNASATVKRNISSGGIEDIDGSRELQTSHNTIGRLSVVVPARSAEGTVLDGSDRFHPLVVSYLQQTSGDYEMGDGSADIADPSAVDAVYVALSQDDGETWANFTLSDSSAKSSIEVAWYTDPSDPDFVAADNNISYPGHAQKPSMVVEGNNILVAWNDKWCPSGNPLGLPETLDEENKTVYPSDYFAVNGPQGSIDYRVEDNDTGELSAYVAPNEKLVYEVPFSCVWTARGIYNPTDGNITWHAPLQLTSGMRDSNHIKVTASDVGFALAWQEDTEGLKAGKGAGPGVGWSGATGNRGTDIWYTSIKMEDFIATDGIDLNNTEGRLKSLNNFHYPVRITDNEQCQDTDKKLYCQDLCGQYGYVTSDQGNQSGDTVNRCKTGDTDMLTDTPVVLDGDTGASRPAFTIQTNDQNQSVVIFGYEETKALSENDTNDTSTDIALEGKSVYFESFAFDAIDAFDPASYTDSNTSPITTVNMPLVSAGNIVNVKVPREDNPSEMIFENARRLVIGTQVSDCEPDANTTFVFMYKQSFDTQGASSDMFIRVNEGFTYDSFVPQDGRIVTNISAQAYKVVDLPSDYNITWSEDNLDDNTYENPEENTFSPRIFLRGDDIYTGFAYTPNDAKTVQENMPSNFHIHRYIDGVWQGPQNITQVVKGQETTVDARFVPTPKGSASTTGLESDRSNPNVLFVTWGNIDDVGEDNTTTERSEADLFYTRSTDGGETWEPIRGLANRAGTTIEEKEVVSFASPDGKKLYNVWLQQSEVYNSDDHFSGLDSWFGRVDYNISIVAP